MPSAYYNFYFLYYIVKHGLETLYYEIAHQLMLLYVPESSSNLWSHIEMGHSLILLVTVGLSISQTALKIPISLE